MYCRGVGKVVMVRLLTTISLVLTPHLPTPRFTLLLPGLGSGLFFVGYSLSMIPSQYILTQVCLHSVVLGV